MKRLIFIASFILLASCSTTQKQTPDAISDTQKNKSELVPIFVLDTAPVFPGCQPDLIKNQQINCLSKKIAKHIRRQFNMRYLINNNITEHRIIASFIVNKDGSVSNVKTDETNPQLLQETIRVLTSLPVMQPAQQNNQSVATSFTIPIKLVLH